MLSTIYSKSCLHLEEKETGNMDLLFYPLLIFLNGNISLFKNKWCHSRCLLQTIVIALHNEPMMPFVSWHLKAALRNPGPKVEGLEGWRPQEDTWQVRLFFMKEILLGIALIEQGEVYRKNKIGPAYKPE